MCLWKIALPEAICWGVRSDVPRERHRLLVELSGGATGSKPVAQRVAASIDWPVNSMSSARLGATCSDRHRGRAADRPLLMAEVAKVLPRTPRRVAGGDELAAGGRAIVLDWR